MHHIGFVWSSFGIINDVLVLYHGVISVMYPAPKFQDEYTYMWLGHCHTLVTAVMHYSFYLKQ